MGAQPTRAGPKSQSAGATLLRATRLLWALNLPRMPFPDRLLALYAPVLTLRITGKNAEQGQAEVPVHSDAADLYSVSH